MKAFVLGILVALALPVAALAQPPPATSIDTPIGAPYRVGSLDDNSTVSIRDFLSSRIDQLRDEIVERISAQTTRLELLINERDRQYDQRFRSAEARAAADVAAAKEAIAAALATQVNERIETRAKDFATAASLTALEKNIAADITINRDAIIAIDKRMSELIARGTGVGDAWIYLGGLVALIVGGLGIFGFFRRPHVVGK